MKLDSFLMDLAAVHRPLLIFHSPSTASKPCSDRRRRQSLPLEVTPGEFQQTPSISTCRLFYCQCFDMPVIQHARVATC